MTVPESIQARIRWLADPENAGHPEAYLAARALADEFEAYTAASWIYLAQFTNRPGC